MFAPRHEDAARVLRPGGPLASPPPLSGFEPHVRRLFAGTGVDVAFERDEVVFRFDSVDEAVDFSTPSGSDRSSRCARRSSRRGAGDSMLEDLVALFERGNTAGDGSFAEPAEYLMVIGRQA